MKIEYQEEAHNFWRKAVYRKLPRLFRYGRRNSRRFSLLLRDFSPDSHIRGAEYKSALVGGIPELPLALLRLVPTV